MPDIKQYKANHADLIQYLKGAPVPISLVKGPQHQFVFVNDSYLKSLFGGRDVIGMTVLEAVPESEKQGFIALLDNVYKTGVAHQGTEVPLKLKQLDGSEKLFYLDFVYEPVFDKNKQVEGIFTVVIDVTNKVHAREAVENEKNWYESILNKLPTSLFLIDPDQNKSIFSNESGAKLVNASISGQSPEVRYPKSYKTFDKHGRFLEAQELPSSRVCRGEDLKNEEVTVENKNGRFDLLVTSEMIPESFGHKKTALMLYQDISFLKAQEEKFRHFTELAPQMPFIADAQGNIIYYSPKWYEYIGHKEGTEGWGWSQNDIIHPADFANTVEVWTSALKSGTAYENKYRIRRHDGQYRWHLGRATPLKDPQGKILKWYGTNVDIHDIKSLENRLKSAVEAADLGFWEYDILAGVVTWNEQLRNHYGFPEGQLEGTIDEVFERIHPEDRHKVQEGLEDAYSDRKKYSLKFRVVTPQGVTKWLDCMGEVYKDAQGRAIFMNGTSQDITEEITHQLEIQKSKEQAEAANSIKSAFLANMSHEIRTPLGAILGFTDLLKNKNIDAEAREYLKVIERNGQALTTIIDDILDLSKVESGRMTIEKIPFVLCEVMKDVVALFSDSANSKGIQLNVDASQSGAPLKIVSDPIRVRQVLINLIGNAVKFTHEGHVLVRIKTETVGAHQQKIVIEVEDTGIGLAEEQKDKIFQPFVQADETTTRKFGGTGLGLVLSRRLARVMNGDVYLKDEKRVKGSTFVFELTTDTAPTTTLANSATLKNEKSDLKNTSLNNIKILVVDDSADNRLLMNYLLDQEGAEIEEASGGEVAVQKALAKDFDIVLMDIQMPGMDGYSALRALKDKNYPKPIIALTAHAMIEEKKKALEAGFCEHVTKPVEKEKLVKAILSSVKEQREQI